MAIMVFAIDAILLFLDYIGVRLNSTIGVLAYTLFPGLLLFYLLLIPIGMLREWRRRHREKGLEPPPFPRFDFNIKSQRIQLYIFILGTSLVGLLCLAVGFRAFEFTESVTFCGNICHSVMEPETTTYQNSPHARVACVQCHVGEGATWYVKSKLSGLYQVYATLFSKHPRPIETPVHNLRPSIDTCERCHWPSKFYGARQVSIKHYEEDEKNSPRQIEMLMNIGGGIAPTGIHWHVGQDEVFYIARDKTRQDIPWVKVISKDGHETIYTDSQKPLTESEIAQATPRKMDCLDCHNRPTHIFQSPKQAMDTALAGEEIPTDLPYIKKLGVEILSKDFPTREEAQAAIYEKVTSFYKDRYPHLSQSRAAIIEAAGRKLNELWQKNNFPYMKSKWSVYPNNIGHLVWDGCFRCHDGNHKNEYGKEIVKDCLTCHIFLSENSGETTFKRTTAGKSFEHPVDIGGEELRSRCSSCHAN